MDDGADAGWHGFKTVTGVNVLLTTCALMESSGRG
ncbi:hypothetical protein AI2614V1_1137 [Klebsiella oxytoca]|nr:hypothetical protein AI2614V1_1137 [Klebsiella oxytoca]CAH3477602.1 hypothetical protein AI2614V1_1137 [Klebsiella oxytoca]